MAPECILNHSVRLHPRDLLLIILGFSLFSLGIKNSSEFSQTLDFVQTDARIEEYLAWDPL